MASFVGGVFVGLLVALVLAGIGFLLYFGFTTNWTFQLDQTANGATTSMNDAMNDAMNNATTPATTLNTVANVPIANVPLANNVPMANV